MSDESSIFNRNPLGGRFSTLNSAHERGRTQKAEQTAQSWASSWKASAKPAQAQGAARPPSYTDLNRQHQAAADRAERSRQVGVNAAAVTTERHGQAATAPAEPIRRDAQPIEAPRSAQAQGRGAPQPTLGGTMFTTPVKQAVGKEKNVYTTAAQQSQQPAHQKSNPFTTSVTKEDVTRLAGMQQGRELDRGR